jgi:hypothetical protein
MIDSDPSVTAGAADVGDDTARRYTYQWTYAGILACALLDETSELADVFCEHHEDILLRYDDNTFTGVQVKTRQLDGDPWKANEQTIVAACGRFVDLDHRFPGKFRGFIIASNHPFLSQKKTGTCLPYLLKVAHEAANVDLADPKLRTYLKVLAKGAKRSESECLATLKKCRCDPSLPKLEHIKRHLASTISDVLGPSQDSSIQLLERAADALVAECHKASALDHVQCLPAYISALSNPAAELERVIAGKRITPIRLRDVLDSAMTTRPLLVGAGLGRPALGAPYSILDRKLGAGGFSIVSVLAARDLRDKAEYKSIEWMNRYGEPEGLKRHEHIRTIVHVDCATAYENSKRSDRPFGKEMLESLRHRFIARRETGDTPLYDTLGEHLEGHAYALTNDCKVWWSDPFPITETS